MSPPWRRSINEHGMVQTNVKSLAFQEFLFESYPLWYHILSWVRNESARDFGFPQKQMNHVVTLLKLWRTVHCPFGDKQQNPIAWILLGTPHSSSCCQSLSLPHDANTQHPRTGTLEKCWLLNYMVSGREHLGKWYKPFNERSRPQEQTSHYCNK